MQEKVIKAGPELKPITVQEMVDAAPKLFCASAKFLFVERHEAALAAFA